ncbi:unnamed protein product [Caenorhabditis angaria]|uniref:G-protein coupled receptors family 1 profile domain-containing protein n=1 Tax=Caenorhabditis angaria TaxID=860376 RepID=A0A9P1N7D8_9PELO|nr:unnamed protein product [Caenorhabditis angaria]
MSIYVILLLTIYILSAFIIFPLFVHFTKINREKDEKVPIYQITNHLYKITFISQFIIFVSAISIATIFLGSSATDNENDEKKFFLFFTIGGIAFAVVYIFNQIVVPIQNLLIFLLAFQRFLLYFYPRSEKYIVPSEKRFSCIIRWIYFIWILGFILYIALVSKCISAYIFTHVYTCPRIYSTINSAIYVTLDFLVIFSSLFYISILISVRKITSMSTSVMRTRPEKAIIYQTLILIIVKLLCLPFVLIEIDFLLISDINTNSIMNVMYYPFFIIDILTTPIVFQITYLFCNKTNLEVLLKMNFRKLKTWSIVCCGYTSSNIVNYQISNISGSISNS